MASALKTKVNYSERKPPIRFIYMHMHMICMAKTIAVSNEVYEILARSKLPGESFSKVIKRNAQRRGRLSDIIGTKTLSKKDWEIVSGKLKKSEELSTEKMLRYVK